MRKSKYGYIIHYYFKRLRHFAKQIKPDFNEDAIHLFRVEVKKLRAFLRMMRIGTKEPGRLKFPHKFKKMYSLTGKIRDRQLCIKRIQEYNSTRDKTLQSKISILQEEIKTAETNNNFLNKKELSEIEEKIIKELPGKSINVQAKKFLAKKIETINEIISKGNYRDQELHNIRKNIKDIIYIARIFRDDMKVPLRSSFPNKNELKKAETISHTLGLFNDTCIALLFFKPVDIKKFKIEESKNLSSMRRKWFTEKRKLKKEILSALIEIRLG